MVRKSVVALGILAAIMMAAGVSWGYTVSKWPVPGIPNTTYLPGGSCLAGVGPEDVTLRGPVAPACEPPLIPGVIHAALSIPFRALAIAATPIFTGSLAPGQNCCPIELDGPAYVTAAVPCTPVNIYTGPKGW
ncbi:MAG: hypothetical protein ACP5U1_16895 [Desulfomonilaceae bacterium]